MKDAFGRTINYLRISLTDRCTLRCLYCLPEHARFRPARELMTDAELLALFGLFVDLGFTKFRLTGGEPTLRPGLIDLVRAMAQYPNVVDITMTTNGLRLPELARPLADAGLRRCNISLDSLRPAQFHAITRRGHLESVLAGVRAAEEAGLLPIKINCVVMRGCNDGQDVVDLARLTLAHDWQVRFIELMPFDEMAGYAQDRVVTGAEIQAHVESHLGVLMPVNGGRLDGEARLYRLEGARGLVGFISSVSQPFCAACSRARLTADGRLRLCLLSDTEVDLLTPLRAGASHDDLRSLIRTAIQDKPWGHRLAEDVIPTGRLMAQIGG